MRALAEVPVYIGFGGNRGQVLKTFQSARRILAERGLKITRMSSAYRNRAMAVPGKDQVQDDYWNAVGEVVTSLSPEEVLVHLLATEKACGRVRRHRWAPRTLDLDLLLHGDRVVDSAGLQVPHPGIMDRIFVLRPLGELRPHRPLPRWKMTVAERLGALADPNAGILEVVEDWWGDEEGLTPPRPVSSGLLGSASVS